MRLGELLGVGRDADVYAVDDAWVVRRSRNGWDQPGQAAVMAHLRGHGFPVPVALR